MPMQTFLFSFALIFVEINSKGMVQYCAELARLDV